MPPVGGRPAAPIVSAGWPRQRRAPHLPEGCPRPDSIAGRASRSITVNGPITGDRRHRRRRTQLAELINGSVLAGRRRRRPAGAAAGARAERAVTAGRVALTFWKTEERDEEEGAEVRRRQRRSHGGH